jgi:putative DNA primase/helicase
MATYKEMREAISMHFEGRWSDVLSTLVSSKDAEKVFDRNIACPECGSENKFYMIDKNAARCHCCKPSCGFTAFDGIALARALGNYAREIDVCNDIKEKYANELSSNTIIFDKGYKNKIRKPVFVDKPSAVKQKIEKPKLNAYAEKTHKGILEKIVPIDAKEAKIGRKYFKKRGFDIDVILTSMVGRLFFHPNLYYKHVYDDEKGEEQTVNGWYPAIIAKIFSHDGELIGFHRIYLDKDGNKADVPEAKKLVSPKFENEYGTRGCVIPLGNTCSTLGICEGIETALAVISMGAWCWSLVDAHKLQNFIPPKWVKVLNVYGDLDRSGTGQLVMIKLLERLKLSRPDLEVNLLLPPSKMWDKAINPKGIDFLDAFLAGYTLPVVYKTIVEGDVHAN